MGKSGILKLCTLSTGKNSNLFITKGLCTLMQFRNFKSDSAFQRAITVTVCFVATAWPSLMFHFSAIDSISRSTGEMCLSSKALCK